MRVKYVCKQSHVLFWHKPKSLTSKWRLKKLHVAVKTRNQESVETWSDTTPKTRTLAKPDESHFGIKLFDRSLEEEKNTKHEWN